MERKVKRGPGSLLMAYVIIAMVFFGLYMLMTKPANEDKSYNDTKLIQDIKDGNVISVDIYQNREIPTGTVEVSLESGSVLYYTPNVSETAKVVTDKDVVCNIHDVDRAGFWRG